MVFLTITPSIVEALETIQSLQNSSRISTRTEAAFNSAEPEPLQDQVGAINGLNDTSAQRQAGADEDEGYHQSAYETGAVEDNKGKSEEPSLSNPRVGNPIAHGQVLDLLRQLKHHSLSPSSLDLLLRGSKVYVPPPPAKPEPTSEYKALMARLRRDEELRAYDRMINPLPPMQSFSQQFPTSSAANAFVSNHRQQDEEDDEVTYADINKQMTLILNVLVTIVACGAAIWMIARWWPTPARLAISMIGSLVIGVAEVVVYGGYLRRVGEAKDKAKDLKEVKEVVKTWVVGGGGENPEIDTPDEPVMIERKADLSNAKRRKRKEGDSA